MSFMNFLTKQGSYKIVALLSFKDICETFYQAQLKLYIEGEKITFASLALNCICQKPVEIC